MSSCERIVCRTLGRRTLTLPTASSSPTYIYLAPDTSPTVPTERNRKRFCFSLRLFTESQKNWNIISIGGEPSRHAVIDSCFVTRSIRKGAISINVSGDSPRRTSSKRMIRTIQHHASLSTISLLGNKTIRKYKYKNK